VVEKQVHRGTGDEGRQLLEEFDGLEEEVGGAVAPHTVWEFDEDAPVGAEAEAILSERGAEEIAAVCGPGSYADQAPTCLGGTLRMPRRRPPRGV